MSSLFPSHGRYHLCRDGCILVTEVEGPWNLELVQEWAKEALPLCHDMRESGPWVAIAIAEKSMLATPEAMQALRRTVEISVQQFGCVAHVIVAAASVEGKGVVEYAFEQAYQGLCASAFFDDYATAKQWAQNFVAQQQK